VLTKEGQWPGIHYPRVPGHEIAGIVDELGAGVSTWNVGQRVGVGWHGGQGNKCPSFRRGDFRNCRNLKIPGISYDGGYQQYMLAPNRGPGSDTGNAQWHRSRTVALRRNYYVQPLRHSGAMPGDLVAVRGIGGLGHLGIQFANKFGYKVAAIGLGSETAALAKKLGASVYIDSKAANPAEELQNPSSKSMTELFSTVWRRTASPWWLVISSLDLKPGKIPPQWHYTIAPYLWS
jgi:D-arabinose 1-dehydrogenase-like Zn-dependent alcohol dehydrogenase